jgi:predicted PurR-regulated permease PerM
VDGAGRAAVPRWLALATAYSWRLLVVGAAVVALALAISRLYLVFLPLFAALLFATFLWPVADWLTGRGLHRGLAAATTVVGGIGVLAGLGALLGPPFVSAIDDLGDELTEAIDAAEGWLVDGPLDLSQEQLGDAVDRAAEQLRDNVGTLSQSALSGAIVVVEIVTGTLLAVVLLFFLLKDGERIWQWLLGLFDARRGDVDELGRRAWATLGGYVRGLTVVAAFDAVFIGLALLAIGVPLVLPLAVITFFAAYVPIVGATASGLLAVVVALVTLGFVEALLVLAAIVAVQQLEGNVLHPLVVGRAVELHPIAILLAVTAGALLFGVIGAFVAVPVAAVAATALAYGRERRPAAAEGAGLTLHDAR